MRSSKSRSTAVGRSASYLGCSGFEPWPRNRLPDCFPAYPQFIEVSLKGMGGARGGGSARQDRRCMYKGNMEARSRNPFCRGNAINITYSECVSLALVI